VRLAIALLLHWQALIQSCFSKCVTSLTISLTLSPSLILSLSLSLSRSLSFSLSHRVCLLVPTNVSPQVRRSGRERKTIVNVSNTEAEVRLKTDPEH